MDSSPDDEFDRKYDLLKHEIDRAEDLRKSFQGATNASASNINIHAGGIGVIVSACCCAMMLVLTIVLMLEIYDIKSSARTEKDKQDVINREYQFQLNSLYARYPYLRPEKVQ